MTDALTEWILNYKSGTTWFNKLNAHNTIRLYLSGLKRYCNWTKKTPDELIQLKIEGLKSINTITEFQAEDLLETFLSTSDISILFLNILCYIFGDFGSPDVLL